MGVPDVKVSDDGILSEDRPRPFLVGDKVRRVVDGMPMVIVGPSRLGRGEWECAWMDKHLRHTDGFTRYEIEMWSGWTRA